MRPKQRRNLRADRRQGPWTAAGVSAVAPRQGAVAPREGAVTITLDDVDKTMVDDREQGRRGWAVPDQCDVGGCPRRITWSDADLVDLETGVELPGLFCDEHTIAYLHRQL